VDPLTDATQYSVQVVQPSFGNVQALILDSNVTTNKLFVSLGPGNYQWRIRARNGSSNTNYQVYSFSVDSNLNINNQTVLLTSPANNSAVGTHTVTFNWARVYTATSYHFILNSSIGSLILDTTVTATSLRYGPLTDGSYIWKVNAQNANGFSPSSSFNLTVDSVSPPTPLAFSASVYAFPSDSFTLSWTRATAPSGFTYYDTLVIYSDSLQSNTVKALAITTASPVTYKDSLHTGTYYSKVATKDAAGNTSAFTTLLRFILP
jgi:hypothetical protein